MLAVVAGAAGPGEAFATRPAGEGWDECHRTLLLTALASKLAERHRHG